MSSYFDFESFEFKHTLLAGVVGWAVGGNASGSAIAVGAAYFGRIGNVRAELDLLLNKDGDTSQPDPNPDPNPDPDPDPDPEPSLVTVDDVVAWYRANPGTGGGYTAIGPVRVVSPNKYGEGTATGSVRIKHPHSGEWMNGTFQHLGLVMGSGHGFCVVDLTGVLSEANYVSIVKTVIDIGVASAHWRLGNSYASVSASAISVTMTWTDDGRPDPEPDPDTKPGNATQAVSDWLNFGSTPGSGYDGLSIVRLQLNSFAEASESGRQGTLQVKSRVESKWFTLSGSEYQRLLPLAPGFHVRSTAVVLSEHTASRLLSYNGIPSQGAAMASHFGGDATVSIPNWYDTDSVLAGTLPRLAKLADGDNVVTILCHLNELTEIESIDLQCKISTTEEARYTWKAYAGRVTSATNPGVPLTEAQVIEAMYRGVAVYYHVPWNHYSARVRYTALSQKMQDYANSPTYRATADNTLLEHRGTAMLHYDHTFRPGVPCQLMP